MNKSFYNIDESQNCVMEPDALSVFRNESIVPGKIRRGMPQNQIAEIVSDKLIDYIKRQFESVERQRQKSK